MKNLIVLTMFLSCSILDMKAQIVYAVGGAPPTTTQLVDVRYEFVQSATNSAQSFLVDKFSGTVWRYVKNRKRFEEVVRELPDSVNVNIVNYQLYISATNSLLCYLLNVHTGEMWQYTSEDGDRIFRKMEMPWDVMSEK